MIEITSKQVSFVYLGLAIFFEVLGTICIKEAHGFTKLKPSLLLFFYYAMSFITLTLATKKLDVSMVYPIWTGTTIAIVAILGIVYWNEPMSFAKTISLGSIIIGLFGLMIGSRV